MFDFLKQRAAQVATLILVLQAVCYYGLSRTETIPRVAPWQELPRQTAHWSVTDDSVMDAEILAKLQPDDYIYRLYRSADSGTLISLFVGYFKSQRHGRAPHSPKACLPGAGWNPIRSSVVDLAMPGGTKAVLANEFIVGKGNSKLVVVYWYQRGEETLTDEIHVQFQSLPELLLHGRTDNALVRVILPVQGEDIAGAETTARGFAREILPQVLRHIR